MAVGTTLAIIGAVSFVASIGYNHYNSAKEKKQLRISEINNDIKTYNALILVFEDLDEKINKSIEYFEMGRNEFKNGGHVFQGVPLANTEFDNTVSKLNSSLETIKKLINTYEKEIKKLEQEKKDLQ